MFKKVLLHSYQRKVGIQDTDFTKRVYCPRAIDWAICGFESLLFCLEEKPDMPIVHAEVDWKKSVYWSDLLEIELHLEKVGNRSFTLETLIFHNQQEVAKVKIVYVLLDQPLLPFIQKLISQELLQKL